ncbi:hypothetical protein DFH08DRAFT_823846 [Mycena albidolilacea]|uniref:Uncharacterized protein n=1 Tax=Mycena albidolilacea TaxID=1033008 RepID=A0AAD6Z5U1_9AGAR|nr:hypothetical protein DFH08DRAFT_823846 [Mycena albidolilacea]
MFLSPSSSGMARNDLSVPTTHPGIQFSECLVDVQSLDDLDDGEEGIFRKPIGETSVRSMLEVGTVKHHQIERKLVWPATIVRTCSGWQTSEVAGIISTPAIKLSSENLDSLMRVTPGTKGKSMPVRATLVQRQTSKRSPSEVSALAINVSTQVLAGRPFKKDLKLFKAQLKSSSRGLKSLSQQVWDPKAATWSPVPCLA